MVMMISVTFFCFEIMGIWHMTFFPLFAVANKGKGAILLLSDLSAGFDLVDHGILIEHLKIWVGI